MHNARGRRHHPEIPQSTLPPFQEFIAFLIAFKFQGNVLSQSLTSTEGIHLHRMVNDQIALHLRVYFFNVPAQIFHGIAHGCHVNHTGNAGKILKDNTAGFKGDLLFFFVGLPVGDGIDVFLGDLITIKTAQGAF